MILVGSISCFLLLLVILILAGNGIPIRKLLIMFICHHIIQKAHTFLNLAF